MQYHDPHHLDADISIIGTNFVNAEADREITWKFEGEVPLWPRKYCDSNVLGYSLWEIERDIGFHKQGIDEEDESLYTASSEGTVILSSILLFPEQQRQLEALQAKIRELAREYQPFRNAVKDRLQETIDIRKERRREIQQSREQNTDQPKSEPPTSDA